MSELSFVTLAYIGGEPGGVVHEMPGPSMEFPERAQRFVFEPRGRPVRIDSPPEAPETLDKYRQLCLLNPSEWQLVDSG